MTKRMAFAALVAVGVVVTAFATVRSATAQNAPSSSWEHPMTPWGEPDIQGMWPINHMTGVPLVRPPEFGTRNVLTDEEFAAREEMLNRRNEAYDIENQQDKIGMGHWAEAGQVPTRVASLIVDPPDGQFPELTEEGKRRAELMGSSWFQDVFDDTSDFDVWDRCITRGLPASMFPMQYNNGIQIIQTPGYVVIRLEMIHEARIIPTNGVPPLREEIRQWLGDSRGRWEGNTLVVETGNFNGLAHMTNIGTSGSPRGNTPTSEKLHITERFTRISENQLEYEITVEDPVVIEEPWTAAFTWLLNPEYEFFEYACHEGNDMIRNYITTSRHERREQARND